MSGFFHDPDAFRALAALVPSLFAEKGPGDAVRVWVVGCATGEEAYSIAMLLSEHAATLAAPPKVQIFATNIDETGYARARDALYSTAAAAGLPAERLGRFFVREAGGYRVRESLREGVLFAVHDVLRDTPFLRLDLVSCRGLLVHLQAAARERVVRTFHAALRPGGVLFLGATDSVGDGRRFVPAQRIYLRRGPGAASVSGRTRDHGAGRTGTGQAVREPGRPAQDEVKTESEVERGRSFRVRLPRTN